MILAAAGLAFACVGPSDESLSGGHKGGAKADSGVDASTGGSGGGKGGAGGMGGIGGAVTGGGGTSATGGTNTGGASGAGGSSTCEPACSPFESCQGGTCQCTGTLVRCGSDCVDLKVDPFNCGNCGTKCTSGHVCSNGACGCPAGTDLCTSECRTHSSQDNCNILGNQCQHCSPSVIVGYKTCINNSCKDTYDCPTGTLCGGVGFACVDLDRDWMNCGACGTKCADGEICAVGKCQPYRPAFGCSACPCVTVCTALVGPVYRCCPSPSSSNVLLCIAGTDCPAPG